MASFTVGAFRSLRHPVPFACMTCSAATIIYVGPCSLGPFFFVVPGSFFFLAWHAVMPALPSCLVLGA
eukprot:5031159-Karenia_brevis.AAC.1